MNGITISANSNEFRHSTITIRFAEGANRAELIQKITDTVQKSCSDCWCIDNLNRALDTAIGFGVRFRYLMVIAGASQIEPDFITIPTRYEDNNSEHAISRRQSKLQKINQKLVNLSQTTFASLSGTDPDSQSRWLDAFTRLQNWCNCKSHEANSIMKDLQEIAGYTSRKKQAFSTRYSTKEDIFGLAFPETDQTMLETMRIEIDNDKEVLGITAVDLSLLISYKKKLRDIDHQCNLSISITNFIHGNYDSTDYNSPTKVDKITPFLGQCGQMTIIGIQDKYNIKTTTVLNSDLPNLDFRKCKWGVLDDFACTGEMYSAHLFVNDNQFYLALGGKKVTLYQYDQNNPGTPWSFYQSLTTHNAMMHILAINTYTDTDKALLAIGLKGKVRVYDLHNLSIQAISSVFGSRMVQFIRIFGDLILASDKTESVALYQIEKSENKLKINHLWTSSMEVVGLELRKTIAIIATTTDLHFLDLRDPKKCVIGATWSPVDGEITQMTATNDAILVTTSVPGNVIRLMYKELDQSMVKIEECA